MCKFYWPINRIVSLYVTGCLSFAASQRGHELRMIHTSPPGVTIPSQRLFVSDPSCFLLSPLSPLLSSVLSWSWRTAATLMEVLSAQKATRSCRPHWREQGALETHAHLPSSKWTDHRLSHMHHYTSSQCAHRACEQLC